MSIERRSENEMRVRYFRRSNGMYSAILLYEHVSIHDEYLRLRIITFLYEDLHQKRKVCGVRADHVVCLLLAYTRDREFYSVCIVVVCHYELRTMAFTAMKSVIKLVLCEDESRKSR